MNRASAIFLFLANVALAEDWRLDSEKDNVAIYSRTRSGSSLKEFRAIGIIDAPTDLVFAVIDDAESYSSFMPYTAEARVLKRTHNSLVGYQRLKFPLISDRDYTLLVKHQRDGSVHRIRWQPANDLGPAPKAGVLRVNVCEGGWLLEPQPDNRTRATYEIFTDSGGTIPAFIANTGSRVAIRKIFEAIRKQVKNPKYATSKQDSAR